VLGCRAIYGVPDEIRDSKLHARGEKGFFVGYDHYFGSKGYRIWDPENDNVTISRDVVFREDEFANSTALETSEEVAADKEFTVPKELEIVEENPPASLSESEFLIERIQAESFADDGERLFRVKWKGYRKTTWEPFSNVSETDTLER